ncbi:MAG: hypothetical protein QM538_06375 [Methylacidiphilales bacterium]|nr:hypothetical protein [Candidatus Methylacidiphilales bacterium]
MGSKHTANDFYTLSYQYPLIHSHSETLGAAFVEIEIYKNINAKNLKTVNGYIVHMKHRVVINNLNPQVQVFNDNTGASYNYIGGITNSMLIIPNVVGGVLPTITTLNVYPKTLNAAVQTSATNSSSSGSSSSTESTTGSSDSSTNSFSAGISGGLFGFIPTGSLDLGYSGSWSKTSFSQDSTGTGKSSDTSASGSDSMTVKDWSCVARKNSINNSIIWEWSQIYPVDIMRYYGLRQPDGDFLYLPPNVSDKLVTTANPLGNTTDTIYLPLPPSDLSLKGVDFVHRIAWQLDYPPDALNNDPLSLLSFLHSTQLCLVTHGVEYSELKNWGISYSDLTELNAFGTDNFSLLMTSLTPIDTSTTEIPATVSTSVLSHIRSNQGNAQCLVSPINDLVVQTNSFSLINAELAAQFSSPSPTITINFKIADLDTNYELFLLHRVDGSDSINLNWTVNNVYSGVLTISSDLHMGENIRSAITLRNLLNFASTSYLDYLLVGFNTISVSVSRSTNTTSYSLTGVSIQ